MNFKVSVSNWEFKIADTVFQLKAVMEEKITYKPDRFPIIVIKNADISNELVNLIYKGQNTEYVKQEFQLLNNLGQIVDTITWEYTGLKIKSVTIKSKDEEFTTMDIKVA
jgi:hypothetical protein